MKRIISLVSILGLLLLFTACSTKEAEIATATESGTVTEKTATTETKTETTTETTTEPATETATETVTETATEIEPVVEPVQLSGKVVVYCPSPAGMADKIAASFTEKTGVEVEMFQGTTGEILARLETEKDNPIADVVIMASWADGLKMIEEDQLMSYAPQNSENIYWADADNKIFGTSASALGVIYNTTIIPELNADWNELGSNPEYKDQIVIPDPLKSGSCKDFLSGFVNVYGDDGQAIIDSWVSNGVSIPGANKAALEAVVTGEKGILIAGVDYNGYDAIAKGEPLGIYYPKSGTVINPRPAMILKTSKNVDNAKAYMDYLLSDDAQQLVGDAYLLPGMKSFKTDKRANVEEVPSLELDWTWMGEHSQEIADKLVNNAN